MRRFALPAALAVTLLAPSAALAAPTLNAPTPASLADSRPLFSWTSPAGESVQSITVASNPDVTPDGSFFSENIKDFGIPADGATSYQDTYRMNAGTYWWNVRWEVDEPYSSAYSAPGQFTVPAYVRNIRNKVTQYTYVADWFDVNYVANGTTARVTCSVFHGRKRIGTRNAFDKYVRVGEPDSSYCRINVGRGYAGKRLKFVSVVRSGGVTRSKTTFFTGKRR